MAEADGADKLVTANIELSPRARSFVTAFRSSFNVFQKAGVEKALEFVASLPPAVQQEVFREGGDPIGTLVRMKQGEAAGADPNATSIEQAEAIIRQQAERLARIAKGYRRELDDVHGGDKSKKSGKK